MISFLKRMLLISVASCLCQISFGQLLAEPSSPPVVAQRGREKGGSHSSAKAGKTETHVESPNSSPTSPSLPPSSDGEKSSANCGAVVRIKDRAGCFIVGGKVTIQVRDDFERVNGRVQRGPAGEFPHIPEWTYEAKVKCSLSYQMRDSWAGAVLTFRNHGGLWNPNVNTLEFNNACLGKRIVDDPRCALELELGRRPAEDLFDSKLQFKTSMDGFRSRIALTPLRDVGTFSILGSIFLINARYYHLGGAVEAGWLDIGKTGFYLKSSLICWDCTHNLRAVDKQRREAFLRRFSFLNLQFLAGYKVKQGPHFLKKAPIHLYGGAVINTWASPLGITRNQLENCACYLGCSIGQLVEPCSTFFDVNYQIVGGQSIPSFDMAGIGRGNCANRGFYTEHLDGTGRLNTLPSEPVGSTNYHGLSVTCALLPIPNLFCALSLAFSRPLRSDIGPNFFYRKFAVDIAYTF